MGKYKINLKILIPIILLALISILTIYSAATYTSKSLGNLTIKQSVWYLLGFLLVAILVKLKNEYLYRHTWILYILGNISLVGLLLFATPINNSKCWFSIPGIGSIQPSEFMKIFIMLTLATMIHNFRSDFKNPSMKDEFIFLIKTFIIVLIPAVLTFLQLECTPQLTNLLIYFLIYICMMFVSGIRFRWFVGAFLCGALILGAILWLYFFKENLFIKIFGNSIYYRIDRVFAWQNGSGLQLENSIAAIGSAGLFGHGFNKTPIYFPEAATDFIFAVYASNFGLMGVVVLLGIIVFLDVNIILLVYIFVNTLF